MIVGNFLLKKKSMALLPRRDRLALRCSSKVLTVFCVKSYGEQWEGSELRVSAYVVSNDTSSLSNEVNMQHISEAYSGKVSIGTTEGTPPIILGDRLRLRFDLIGGVRFKLMGLLLCDH